MNDGRQQSQQQAGVMAADGETAAGEKKIAAAVERDDAADPRWRKDRSGLDGGQGQVAREAERPAAGHQETIPRPHEHRIVNAFHRQPALAGHYRVALDALTQVGEPHRPFAARIETSRYVAPGLQQRKDI